VRVAGAILGLPRTGSTLLHRLLAASPRLTSTLSWETSYPIPFPGEGPDAEERKRRAEKQAQLFLELSPDFADLHTVVWDGPEEDVILVDRSFVSMSFDSFYWVPDYGDWLRAADQGPAYRELADWLRVLRWQDPARAGRRWVLKSPHHLTAVGTVLDTFDGCKIIMTHRSPVSAVPSYASMVRTMSAQYSGSVDPVAVAATGTTGSPRPCATSPTCARRGPTASSMSVPGHAADPAAEARRVLGELGLVPDAADDAAFEVLP